MLAFLSSFAMMANTEQQPVERRVLSGPAASDPVDALTRDLSRVSVSPPSALLSRRKRMQLQQVNVAAVKACIDKKKNLKKRLGFRNLTWKKPAPITTSPATTAPVTTAPASPTSVVFGVDFMSLEAYSVPAQESQRVGTFSRYFAGVPAA